MADHVDPEETVRLLKHLRDYAEGVDTAELFPGDKITVDEILTTVMNGLNEVIGQLDRCTCPRDQKVYCHRQSCMGGTEYWVATTWGTLAEGDEVRDGDGQTWTVLTTRPLSPGILSASIEREGTRFDFTPAAGQDVMAHRGPTGRALDALGTAFTVEVFANGVAR